MIQAVFSSIFFFARELTLSVHWAILTRDEILGRGAVDLLAEEDRETEIGLWRRSRGCKGKRYVDPGVADMLAIALYQGWLQVGYATLYTMAPVFSLVLDRDVNEDLAMLYPELYKELTKVSSRALSSVPSKLTE